MRRHILGAALVWILSACGDDTTSSSGAGSVGGQSEGGTGPGAGGPGGASQGGGGQGGAGSVCGDGTLESGEVCDDGNTAADDGCAGDCTVEQGWTCDMSSPSTCATTCGDGLIAGDEVCDDAGTSAGDGCSDVCVVEEGWACSGEPSVCIRIGTCSDPIVVTGTGFTWSATRLDPYGDDLSNQDASCAAGSGSSAKPDAVFEVDLAAGETLHVEESGDANVLMHVLSGACDSATACAASFDGDAMSEITPGLNYTAPTDQTVFVVIDTYAGSVAGDDVALGFTISPCGDGMIGPGEGCDDGDSAGGDGCSALCAVEPGYSCDGEPSTCTPIPGISCLLPIVASNGFVFTGDDIAAYGDDLDFPGPTCQDVQGVTFDSPEIVFSIDLLAGEALNVKNLGTLDTVMQVISTCADQQPCSAKWDVPDATGVKFVAPVDGTYFVIVESWENSPMTSSSYELHFDVAHCGNGLMEWAETCDDSNTVGGDGCSTTCHYEPACAVITSESEPNEDGTPSTGGSGVFGNDFAILSSDGAVCADATLTAALTPGGDEDVYALRNTTNAPVTVALETFAPSVGVCTADTVLTVRDDFGVTILNNDEGGLNSCSLIGNLVLPANTTYYVHVTDFGDNSVIPGYTLRVDFL